MHNDSLEIISGMVPRNYKFELIVRKWPKTILEFPKFISTDTIRDVCGDTKHNSNSNFTKM